MIKEAMEELCEEIILPNKPAINENERYSASIYTCYWEK